MPSLACTTGRAFWRRLHDEISRATRYGEPLGLLLADLDGLKRINDLNGHGAGDLALGHVANAIHAELRSTDMGARWGGDEFAILAPNTSEAAALALGERIRTLIEREGEHHHVTASLGVATFDPARDADPFDAAALMRLADDALYAAKQQGKNRVAAHQWPPVTRHAPPPDRSSPGT